MLNEEDLRRIAWQCRRGMLELDVLLEPFAKEALPNLSAEDQQRFVNLLACEDQDLFVWFMERDQPESADLQRIVRIILERVQPS